MNKRRFIGEGFVVVVIISLLIGYWWADIVPMSYFDGENPLPQDVQREIQSANVTLRFVGGFFVSAAVGFFILQFLRSSEKA